MRNLFHRRSGKMKGIVIMTIKEISNCMVLVSVVLRSHDGVDLYNWGERWLGLEDDLNLVGITIDYVITEGNMIF